MAHKIAIPEIKNIDMKAQKKECSLDEWYINILEKRQSELSILDISRMLRQDVFVDIPIAFKRLLQNPFEGEMYDGQLLELLLQCLVKHLEYLDRAFYVKFKIAVECHLQHYELEPQDKDNYLSLISKLDSLYADE